MKSVFLFILILNSSFLFASDAFVKTAEIDTLLATGSFSSPRVAMKFEDLYAAREL